jgi:molecular chaperone GrpE
MTKRKKEQIPPEAADPAESQAAGEMQYEALAVEQPEEVQSAESLLQQELAEALAKSSEYMDGWQRARAEFANYKKRIEREQAQVYQTAAGSIIKRYLSIVDDLERALKNRPQDGDGAAWAEGVELIYRKFLNILDNEGVKPMNAVRQPFDPNLHEAVILEDNDQYESGQVIEVLQQGYTLGDRVLRPAMVRVAR